MSKKQNLQKAIVFTAPSGAGKTTVVRHLLSTYQQLAFSISATSRSKRNNEIDGRDYYFFSVMDFKNKIAENEFVEWEEVYPGVFYGTLRKEVKRLWQLNKYVIFDVDVKGAVNIKKEFKEDCLTVFIRPPSLNILVERLKNRKSESPESLRIRIERVKFEMSYQDQFDQIIVNDVLDTTLKDAEMIVEDFLNIEYV